MKEFIIFVCANSTEIFFSKLRSVGLNYNLPSFFTDSFLLCGGGGGGGGGSLLIDFFHLDNIEKIQEKFKLSFEYF